MRSVSAFIEARDILLRHRDDYDRACSEFRWPQLGEFNWACRLQECIRAVCSI
jgi:acetyl-CoA synthetase